MNKYQSYKSSGVDWIGEIPEKWKISKFKYVSNILPKAQQFNLIQHYYLRLLPYKNKKGLELLPTLCTY